MNDGKKYISDFTLINHKVKGNISLADVQVNDFIKSDKGYVKVLTIINSTLTKEKWFSSK